jgi:hypothetical protein
VIVRRGGGAVERPRELLHLRRHGGRDLGVERLTAMADTDHIVSAPAGNRKFELDQIADNGVTGEMDSWT